MDGPLPSCSLCCRCLLGCRLCRSIDVRRCVRLLCMCVPSIEISSRVKSNQIRAVLHVASLISHGRRPAKRGPHWLWRPAACECSHPCSLRPQPSCVSSRALGDWTVHLMVWCDDGGRKEHQTSTATTDRVIILTTKAHLKILDCRFEPQVPFISRCFLHSVFIAGRTTLPFQSTRSLSTSHTHCSTHPITPSFPTTAPAPCSAAGGSRPSPPPVHMDAENRELLHPIQPHRSLYHTAVLGGTVLLTWVVRTPWRATSASLGR